MATEEFWNTYTTFLDQQKRFIYSGQAYRHIKDAFISLAKLGTKLAIAICHEDEETFYGHGSSDELDKIENMFGCFDPDACSGRSNVEGDPAYFRQNGALNHVLQAILSTALPVETLDVRQCSLTKRVWNGMRWLANRNTTFPEHLRKLTIANVWPSLGFMSPQSILDFDAFWGKIHLDHLIVTDIFDADDDDDGSRYLLGNLICPGLKAFTNENSYLFGPEPERDLTKFLKNHCGTLEWVDLSRGKYPTKPEDDERNIVSALLQCERLSTLRASFFDDDDLECAGLFEDVVAATLQKKLRVIEDDRFNDRKEHKVGKHVTLSRCYQEIEQPALDRVLRYRLSKL